MIIICHLSRGTKNTSNQVSQSKFDITNVYNCRTITLVCGSKLTEPQFLVVLSLQSSNLEGHGYPYISCRQNDPCHVVWGLSNSICTSGLLGWLNALRPTSPKKCIFESGLKHSTTTEYAVPRRVGLSKEPNRKAWKSSKTQPSLGQFMKPKLLRHQALEFGTSVAIVNITLAVEEHGLHQLRMS